MSDNSGPGLPIRWLSIGLAGLPLLYMMLWLMMIVGTFSGLWHPQIGNLDVGTAIRRSAPSEIMGFAAMSLAWLAGMTGAALQRRLGLHLMIAGSLIHIIVWLKITDGQYYSGQFGMIVILLEMLAITLTHFATRGRRLI
ncbi:hypothetical protein [Maricaulis maris]|uniref:hypothetical protein n=1 Tax=Maricaulis maris TaxID=74318 RepID=UPI003A8FF685